MTQFYQTHPRNTAPLAARSSDIRNRSPAPPLPIYNHYESIIIDHVGFVLAFAASPAVSSADDPWFFLKRQVAFATAGLAVLAITSALNITGVRRMSGLALLFSLIMLALVLLVGAELNGAQRWILIGGFSLQPREILKPAFVVFVAWLFSEEDKGAPVPGRIAAFRISLG